jgi:hypothetical protein
MRSSRLRKAKPQDDKDDLRDCHDLKKPSLAMTQNSLLKNLLAFPSLLHLTASSSPQSFLKGKSEDKGGLITPLCSRLTAHD